MRTKYDNVFINPDQADVGQHRAVMAFDLDSVLNDMGHNLRDHVAKKFGLPTEEILDTTAGFEKFYFKIPGIEDREISRAVADYVMEESPSSLATPYMKQVMGYVHSATNSPITVVTARWVGTVGVTKRWLEEQLGDIPFVAYIVNGPPKATVLNHLHTQAFVDDRWKTVEGLMKHIPWPVLYKRPWNARPVYLPVIKANDLRDIIPLLNILTGEVPTAWPVGVLHPYNERGDICFKG